MGKYIEALLKEKTPEYASCPPDITDKSPYVGYVGTLPSAFEEKKCAVGQFRNNPKPWCTPWHIVIDGKSMTAIYPRELTRKGVEQSLEKQFGQGRVEKIERGANHE